MAGLAPASLGIGRTGLAPSPGAGRLVLASAETPPGAGRLGGTVGVRGAPGSDGLIGAPVLGGGLGAGRRGGRSGVATPVPAAGRATGAGLATGAAGAPAGAARCNGGRSACTGGRSGIPLPAPITIEGREAAVGNVFSGSGPRGLTCGSMESVVGECTASASAVSPAAGCCSSCDCKRAFTRSAVSRSIELECVFLSFSPTSGSRSRITFALTSSSRASSFIRILPFPFNAALVPPLSIRHVIILDCSLLSYGVERTSAARRFRDCARGGRIRRRLIVSEFLPNLVRLVFRS